MRRSSDRPLSTRHIAIVRRLIEVGHQSPDLLFSAADAYDEFARHLQLDECLTAAAEAQVLADRLRGEAQRHAGGAGKRASQPQPLPATTRAS